MKKTVKQRVAADEILAQQREATRQRVKAHRERKREENQPSGNVTPKSDDAPHDPLAAARRFLAELEARRKAAG